MTSPATSEAEFATVFDWNPPWSRKLSLLSFVAASAALHALCFYIFQIVYPPTAAPPPPPARVNIITPASEEGRVILRWIEAEDPALSSTTQRPPNASAFLPPKPDYVPSYVNRQPALKEVPPFEPDLRVPSSRPPAPVATPRAATPDAATRVPTSVTFSDEGELGAPALSPLQFTASNKEPPQAAEFRIGVGAGGDVRYCFLQDSSGDSVLDEQARRYLLLARFPAIESRKSKIENDVFWTTATIEWGNDVAAPLANPAEPRVP
jgi:hypothetical protein